MKLRVQYTAQLRAATGRSEDEVELPEGTSLAALVSHLGARLGGAASHLIAADGQAHHHDPCLAETVSKRAEHGLHQRVG